MKNRYDGVLRENNQRIVELIPGRRFLGLVTAHELKSSLEGKDLENAKILEIGVGEGDLTKILHEVNPGITVDALDISREMIEIAKRNLEGTNDRFIESDVLDWLKICREPYDAIVSAWTIHNLPWYSRREVFEDSFRNIKPGGSFILYDKIYPKGSDVQKELLGRQKRRHELYLPADVAEALNEHENQDFNHDYKMEEEMTTTELLDFGFIDVGVVDRVERDAVIVAQKPL